jgi:hypothetical protein
MNLLATCKIGVLVAGLLASLPCRADELEAVDGPNVRTMKNVDGSRTVFIRSPDSRVLTKKTFRNGVVAMVTTYWMLPNGDPSGCKIRDGQNQELFKVAYGYNKINGQLEREVMFDSRVKRINPADGKELPVQIIRYIYDAEGKRSAPIAYNLLPGKKMEDVFGVKSSALESNPFKENAPPQKKR